MKIERKDAETKLPPSKSMLLAAFMAMDEGAILQDGSGEVLTVNPAAEKILGLAAAELIGRSSTDLAQALSRVNEDGMQRWISISARPLAEAGESDPYPVLTTLRDITERVRNDRILEQSEQKYRALAESMPGHLIRHDRQTRVQYANPALLTAVAPAARPPLGQSLVEAHPGSDEAAAFQRLLEGVIATGTPIEVEFQVPNIAGEMRLHQVRYVAERDGNNEIIGALGFGRDITESRQAEMYEQFRTRTLELLSGGASLHDVLESIARGVELLKPEMICGILLLDSHGKRFYKGIEPSLPDFFNAGIDGLEIGIGAGSCGTAAATGERVIVENIQTHPYWASHKAVAARAGVAACWSEPIRSSTGQVLGTFAIYHREPHRPTESDIAILEKSARLASIAIEHMQAEEALRVSEQEFRTLAENLPDTLVRYDRNGRRTYLNPGLERDFSVTDDQVLGQNLHDTNPTDLPLDTYQRALKHTLATGERSKFEINIASGRTCLCFMVAERAGDGQISGAIAVGRDITELKRMEDEIRRREREFRTLVENSPDPIFRYDRNGHRLFVHTGNIHKRSKAVESMLGSTPADGCIVTTDESKKLLVGIRQVVDSGAPATIQVDFVDDYGKRRDHQILLVPELDERGDVATVLGLGRDITAIRDAERQMTQFVANLPGFAYTYRLSPEGHGSFPFVSPGIEKLFGLDPEDLKKDIAPLLAVAHPDDLPRIMTTMDESVRTMAPFRVETRAARPGMTMRWGELRAVPVRQVDGSVLWHGIMVDIDRRKRNEAELEQHRHHLEKLVEERTLALSIAKETAEAATRAKSHFLAAASHDLRQPLQAIRLFNDVLAMTDLNEQQKKIGNSLAKAVGSLSELFNDLLDLSRLDAGTIEPRPAVIQADDLMGVIGAEFDAIFHQKKLRLNLFWPRQGLALFSDGPLLQTMLRNLISNAVKYTLRSGVLVAIRKRGDRALIQVWDTGIGIATEKMDSVFEEYFQIGNPERDRAKGVGLGLAIVKRLSRLLGIGVHLRSREGRGSVFELSVPLVKESCIQASPAQPLASLEGIASPRLLGKRIVVIEDDATAAEAITLALEMDGAHVTLFVTAEDALGSTEIQGAGFYISDYRLPGMNGVQLLDAIQNNSAEPIKAVVLTGNTAPDQVAALQSSRWKVLFKPVHIPELLSALDVHE